MPLQKDRLEPSADEAWESALHVMRRVNVNDRVYRRMKEAGKFKNFPVGKAVVFINGVLVLETYSFEEAIAALEGKEGMTCVPNPQKFDDMEEPIVPKFSFWNVVSALFSKLDW